MRILVTGGAGFIGSNFIRYWLSKHPGDEVVNYDKLTYAGHLESLEDIKDNPRYKFIKGDIADEQDVDLAMEGVDIVVNFAAESHVDRSVIDPLVFARTNILGTAVLLNAALKKGVKRFHHVSTDEVYGDLGPQDASFTPDRKYDPRTPYAASKASSDHLVRAFYKTYGLPITITNCANNYGPYQDPEKLIPRFTTNLLQGKKVPLMGKGENRREWLHVLDHASAIDFILRKGEIGETYLVQGEERMNIEVTRKILEILGMGEEMIEYVPDRLGHDFRYANDGSELFNLGWKNEYNFDDRIKETVEWYRENEDWWRGLIKNRPNVDRSAQKDFLEKNG